MIDWIQDKYQRFTLYMLDQFGILVSLWACFSSIAIIAMLTAVETLTDESALDTIATTIIGFTFLSIFMIYPSLQYHFESKKHFKSFEAVRYRFENSVYLKYICILSSLFGFLLIFNIYSKDHDTLKFSYRMLGNFSYFSYYFFLCCYTRDREPPMHAKISFSPT